MKLRKPRPSVKILLVAFFVLTFVLIYPFQTTIVPVWSLHVIDDLGQSVVGIRVTQHWQHNSLESVSHEDLRTTDARGQVVYPERTIRASLVRRAWSILAKAWNEGKDAKIGVYASVVVWGSGDHDTNVAVFKNGDLPPAEIVVARIR